MKIPRRDLLKFTAGAAAGAVFTPVPWKLLDDVSIWSQNWSWIPRPPKGEPRERFTTCTLCPAGCPVRARCVGSQPVSLAGAAGALCPVGLAGHHLPYHPERLRGALHRGSPAAVDAAVSAVRAAIGRGGPVAILDQRPGRTASLVYRRCLARWKGFYLTPPAREDATLRALERATGSGPLAFDLAKARTVVSFGAPLLDGWGTPASVLAARRDFHLVQVEARQSRTAAAADTWLPVRPGAEPLLALGVAHALGAESVEAFTPERVAQQTGISAGQVRELAARLAANGPAVAIGGGDPAGPFTRDEETAIAGLNLLLGSVGTAIVLRRELPAPAGFGELAPETALEDVPDARIRVLIIDEAVSGNPVPWPVLKRKLAPGALVAAVACTASGYGRYAGYVLPAPAYMESAGDAPAACDSPAAAFSVSAPLLAAPSGVIEAADFVARVAGDAGSLADHLQARAAAIHAARRGKVVNYADGKTTAVREIASAGDFWKAFEQGARWADDPAPPARSGKPSYPSVGARAAVRTMPAGAEWPLMLTPAGWRAAAGPVSPVLAKLYRESDVRASYGEARVHPVTAGEHGIEDGARVVVETRCGSAVMTACVDECVMPGVIDAAVEPGAGVLEICTDEERCGWRAVPARMRRA